jgi:cytochrome P450
MPYLHAIWSGHFPPRVQELHKQYGAVVRVAPNELSFTDPRAWDDIYSNRDGANSRALQKGKPWHGNPDGGAKSVFVTTDLKEHGAVRRHPYPVFSERAVSKQEPIIQQHVLTCVDKLM